VGVYFLFFSYSNLCMWLSPFEFLVFFQLICFYSKIQYDFFFIPKRKRKKRTNKTIVKKKMKEWIKTSLSIFRQTAQASQWNLLFWFRGSSESCWNYWYVGELTTYKHKYHLWWPSSPYLEIYFKQFPFWKLFFITIF
jgi:hypothetical protein